MQYRINLETIIYKIRQRDDEKLYSTNQRPTTMNEAYSAHTLLGDRKVRVLYDLAAANYFATIEKFISLVSIH
jgi:hypothetical protein